MLFWETTAAKAQIMLDSIELEFSKSVLDIIEWNAPFVVEVDVVRFHGH